MADFVSEEKRSKIMRGIRQRNTKPEMIVRKVLHKSGHRLRLHRKDLPGTPDIIGSSTILVVMRGRGTGPAHRSGTGWRCGNFSGCGSRRRSV